MVAELVSAPENSCCRHVVLRDLFAHEKESRSHLVGAKRVDQGISDRIDGAVIESESDNRVLYISSRDELTEKLVIARAGKSANPDGDRDQRYYGHHCDCDYSLHSPGCYFAPL